MAHLSRVNVIIHHSVNWQDDAENFSLKSEPYLFLSDIEAGALDEEKT